MKVTWTDERAINSYLRMTLDADGRALLSFGQFPVRSPPGGLRWVLAEADGRVLNVVADPVAREGCTLRDHELGSGRYVIDVWGNAPRGNIDDHSGHILSGSIGEKPGSIWKEFGAPEQIGTTTFSDDLLVHWNLGRLEVSDWQMGGRRQIYPDPARPDPDSLPPWESIIIGEQVIFAVRYGGNSGIMSWSPEHGLRGLVRYFGDPTRGAGNLGTDGQTMVWTEGEGKPPGGWYGDYATFTIMAAPLSTDSAEVKATSRRVRSDFRGQVAGGDEAWKVGCGYAARFHSWVNGLLFVRLADGAAWVVPSKVPDFAWGQVLGLTCDEVFAAASTDRGRVVARVRLDSLGEPLPPD